MKKFLPIFFTVLLISCGESETPSKGEVTDRITEQNDNSGTLEERAKRHTESILRIPATEKYSLKIFREDLDGDNKKDAVITVNRMDFALEEAATSGNTAKRAELGFMGNYNYIFYYDGALDKISPEIAVPSTPHKELSVTFDHISNQDFKDIIVEYRIRNAKFREYFFVSDHTPRRVFQCKIFDGLGTNKTEAFTVRYDEGTMGQQKDILILSGKIEQHNEEIDEFTFDPEIREGKQLIYRFFYHPKIGKYAIMK